MKASRKKIATEVKLWNIKGGGDIEEIEEKGVFESLND